MAALLDLTKAFDRVWKHKLLIKLHDTFNIRGNTLAWISDFLHHRSMRVNFNNTFSDPVVLGQGVPQGSVLSPTLFSLYLADIEKIPSVEMRVGLFADDIVIWCSGRDLVEMERNLNNALSSFSDYALEFKLCFNPSKSIATFFTTNKRLYSYQTTLKMDNKNLAYEKHPKYLGYVLDPEWSNGSRLDDRAGSGIYIENSGQNFYFCHRNPDFSSVFKSELMAIKLGLEAIINESDYGELWILSDSRSSLQHLHNLTQWIPSHVDIFGNEQADRLAREGCSLLTTSSPAITYSEHQSKVNRQLSKEWKIPPSHHWYAAREPGSFLDLNCDRASKTAISRLASGHTKSLSFFEGRKTFKFCSKCKVQQASAEHILDCLGLSREDLYDSPLLVIDFLRVNNLMDLV
ncbi:probable RNA-directed DNA polymerase from transposon BS [Trichonephila clavipes]|nr:probable RNA-directed DNA polymerase from transposon BS [Trichonephila clavipes]